MSDVLVKRTFLTAGGSPVRLKTSLQVKRTFLTAEGSLVRLKTSVQVSKSSDKNVRCTCKTNRSTDRNKGNHRTGMSDVLVKQKNHRTEILFKHNFKCLQENHRTGMSDVLVKRTFLTAEGSLVRLKISLQVKRTFLTAEGSPVRLKTSVQVSKSSDKNVRCTCKTKKTSDRNVIQA